MSTKCKTTIAFWTLIGLSLSVWFVQYVENEILQIVVGMVWSVIIIIGAKMTSAIKAYNEQHTAAATGGDNEGGEDEIRNES